MKVGANGAAPHKRQIDARTSLSLILRRISSPLSEDDLALWVEEVQSTLSRHLQFALRVLHRTLRRLPQARIQWPTYEELQESERLFSASLRRLRGVALVFDGRDHKIERSADDKLQALYYSGRKKIHCVKSLVVFTATGLIAFAAVNWPGSHHDAFVYRESGLHDRIESLPDGIYAACDSGFRHGTNHILREFTEGEIDAVIRNHSQEFATTFQHRAKRLRKEIGKVQVQAEWGMALITKPWRRFLLSLPANSHQYRKLLFETAMHLSNLRTRCMGINQIFKVNQSRFSNRNAIFR